MPALRKARCTAVLMVAAASLVAGLAGCRSEGSSTTAAGTVPAVPVGSSERTIPVRGQARTFHLYRPAELAQPAALVVMLHGGFGSGTQAEDSYGWDARADAGHFVVAYPDGLDRAWAVGGGCCGSPGRS